jgi:hypothetical protein
MKKKNTKKKLLNKEETLESLVNSMRLFCKFGDPMVLFGFTATIVSTIFYWAYVLICQDEINNIFRASVLTFPLATFTVAILAAISDTVIKAYDKKHSTNKDSNKTDSTNILNEQ